MDEVELAEEVAEAEHLFLLVLLVLALEQLSLECYVEQELGWALTCLEAAMIYVAVVEVVDVVEAVVFE